MSGKIVLFLRLLEIVVLGIARMKNKQVFYWIIDVIILAALVLEYKIDWTGLQIHELLGLAVFGIMMVHLLAHWRWVVSVTGKVFESVSSRATFCYVINLTLLFLFSGIVITGLIISSLLNLPLAAQSYEFWRFLHVSVSYLTLVMVGLKLAIHWKWIVNTTMRKVFRGKKEVPAVAVKADASGVSRRQFLAQTCVFSGAMVIAGVSYAAWIKENLFYEDNDVQEAASTETATPQVIYVTATPEQQQVEAAANTVVTEEGSTVVEEPVVIATAVPTVVPTAIPTNVRPAAASSSQTAGNTSVRCNRGCSYPGHCRRYEDTNGNNRCDLSEW